MKRSDLPNLPTATGVVAGACWLGDNTTAAAVVVTVGAIAYVIEIAWFPWIPCGGCEETGRQWSPFSRTFATCRRCGGLRKQLRWGRRLWTKATDINEARK